MPVGLPLLPGPVSVTVTAQVVESFTATEAGEQATFVDVDRAVTVTSAEPADAR
ncbi:MAG TPA: hypothetical protein VIV12_12505 [Streptosporangiaceae bacterium]